MKNVLYFLFFCLVFAIAFACFYGDVFWHPNAFQGDMSGDGLKNYYTFAYHLEHYSGWWFQGFLYPYGEYTLYTDNQIFLVSLFRFLAYIGIDLSNYSLGLLNGLSMLSFPLGSLFIFKILKHYKLSTLAALFLAAICLLMSPQMFRVSGHFGLSYSFILPGLWYTILLYRKSKHIAWLFLMGAGMLISGFLHPYQLLGTSLFLLAVVLAIALRSRKVAWPLALPMIVSLVAFFLITKVTDTNKEYRPQNPYGLLIYKTEKYDLMPVSGVHNELLKDSLELREIVKEGYCYPSFLMFISFAVFLYFLYGRFRSRNTDHLTLGIDKSLQEYGLAAILILCYAMGLHVLLAGEYIFKLLPQLRQFRGLGRMSWGFYYIAFVFFSVVVYRSLSFIKSKKWTYLFGVIISLILAYESYAYLDLFKKGIDTYGSHDLLHQETRLQDSLRNHSLGADDFQAIIALPLSTEGAEKIGLRDDWHVKIYTLPLSYQLGIPLTTCLMSRVSLESVSKVLPLANSPYGKSTYVEDLPSNKDFLVVIPNALLKDYQDFIKRGSFIDSLEMVSMYRMSPEQLGARKFYSEYLVEHTIDTLISEAIYFDDFEKENNQKGLRSKSSLFIKNRMDTLLTMAVDQSEMINAEMSVWFLLEEAESSTAEFVVKLYDHNDQEVYTRVYRDWEMNRVEVHDRWVRYLWEVPLWPSHSRLDVLVHSENLHVDRVLLLEQGKHFKGNTNDPNWLQVDHLLMQLSED